MHGYLERTLNMTAMRSGTRFCNCASPDQRHMLQCTIDVSEVVKFRYGREAPFPE
jgi:hypothetical protein